MAKKSESGEEKEKEKKQSLLGSFFGKQERDKDYLPDLRSQWDSMDQRERVQFVIGGILGLVLFVGALIGVYLLLSTMM